MKESIKNALGALISVLVIMLIILAGLETKNRAHPAIDISKTRSITMTAEGKVRAKPDTATVAFSVVTTGKDTVKVQADNDQKMKNVMDFLKSKGVRDEDIKTSNYNLYPQYDYNPKPTGEVVPPAITGYNLTQSVSVKVKNLDIVSSLVGGLTAKGVNQIDNVSYFIDDPDALKAQAREMAISRAKDKARDLASKLGIKLGSVINFSEGQSSYPIPMAYDKLAPTGAGGAGDSPIQAGSQDVTINVTLTFEIK